MQFFNISELVFGLYIKYICTMKILIVYASRRGTTRKTTQTISDILEQEGYTVEIKKASNCKAVELKNYRIVLLGSSTWADGDLHEDLDQLERDLRDLDLKGISAAAFGTGNSRFRFFCEAVDILETRLKHSGAKLLLASLKSDIMLKRMQEDAEQWARQLVSAIERDLKNSNQKSLGNEV